MIILSIQPYCETCGDFEADVERPTKLKFVSFEPLIAGNTVIRCKHRELCDRIRRYHNDNKEE